MGAWGSVNRQLDCGMRGEKGPGKEGRGALVACDREIGDLGRLGPGRSVIGGGGLQVFRSGIGQPVRNLRLEGGGDDRFADEVVHAGLQTAEPGASVFASR